MAKRSRPNDVPATAEFDEKTKLWCDRSNDRERRWDGDGTLMLDAPLKNGKLHGDVYWRLAIHDPSEFAPRVEMAKALGLPDGPSGTQTSTFEDGELTHARFIVLEDQPPRLSVALRDGKLHGDFEWLVGPIEEPLFEWKDITVEGKKLFKVPKPWPKKAVATFDKGKVVKTTFFDAKGKPLGDAPGPIADWGENIKPAELAKYIEGGAFAADVARFFPGAKGMTPEDLPKKSDKLAKLPAKHRASADAFDALVRKKKIPFMGRAFDLNGYAFDCVANELEGADDPKYFGIAYDGFGDMFLLDTKTGEVVVYAHEEGTIAKETFASLNHFAFAMLRVELAESSRIPKAALKKLLGKLEIKAGVKQLS